MTIVAIALAAAAASWLVWIVIDDKYNVGRTLKSRLGKRRRRHRRRGDY